MNVPHKRAHVIKAWADGSDIQYSANGVDWHNYPSIDSVTPSFEKNFWRVKPETVKYRRALFSLSAGSYFVGCAIYRECEGEIRAFSSNSGFVRWLDLDWVEAEV